LGLPIKFILTGGQDAECCLAIPLLENVKALVVLADKGYDTNALREWLKEQGIKAVIPPKSNRKEQIECDITIIKSGIPSNACLASSNTTAVLPRVMRKRLSIT